LAGDALVHVDVRSDNVCFRDGHALIVDWVAAGIANPDLDVAAWLPSLAAEGGRPRSRSCQTRESWPLGLPGSSALEPGSRQSPRRPSSEGFNSPKLGRLLRGRLWCSGWQLPRHRSVHTIETHRVPSRGTRAVASLGRHNPRTRALRGPAAPQGRNDTW
jgi:hypothetical protein